MTALAALLLGGGLAQAVRSPAADDAVEVLFDRAVPGLGAGPIVGARGNLIVVAWIEGPPATSPVRVMVSQDAGRRFSGPFSQPALRWVDDGAPLAIAVATPAAAPPGRTSNRRVVIGPASRRDGAGAGPDVLESVDGGRTFTRAPLTPVLALELAQSAWTVTPASAGSGQFHAMPPAAVTRRGPLVIAAPADLAPATAAPIVTFDAHQVVAVVWPHSNAGLVVRRYATSWGSGSPIRTRPFDPAVLLPLDGALAGAGAVPGATGICIVSGTRSASGARVRAIRVPVSLLCAPPARPLA